MTTKIYDKIVLKIEYEDERKRERERGSGVVCLDSKEEEIYLITAWHCLGKNKEINFDKIRTYRQINAEMKEVKLNFKSQPLILEVEDIAILTLEDLEDVPTYSMIEPKKKEDINIVGFPNALDSEECEIQRFSLNGVINELPGKNIIQIDSKHPIETYENNAKGIVSGCSGSPVFVEHNNEIFLTGIVTNLSSSDGAFGSILGVSITRIDEEMERQTGKCLFDKQLCNFSEYKDVIVERVEEEFQDICNVQIQLIDEKTSPNSIIEHLGEKIVWPYSNKEKKNKDVWKTWLLYLIVRCIESKENIENEKYYVIQKNEIERNVKLLYATRHTRLPDFLKDYIQNAYSYIGSNDLIIIGTRTQPYTKYISKEIAKKTVKNISSAVAVKEGIYVDDVENSLQDISVVHIDKIVEEIFGNIDQCMEIKGRELEKQVSDKLKEVLYGY